MTFDRRTYARLYARRQRAKKLAAERLHRTNCPRRMGRFGVCGGALEGVVLPGGRWTLTCRRCERREAGLCIDCPARVDGTVRKSLRCKNCRRIANNKHATKYREHHRALTNKRAKLYARRKRERNAAYKRLWRQANPDKVAAQKRRFYLRQPKKCYAWHRRYNKHYKHAPRARTCLSCPTPVSGRAKKCAPCKAILRDTALRKLGWAA